MIASTRRRNAIALSELENQAVGLCNELGGDIEVQMNLETGAEGRKPSERLPVRFNWLAAAG